MTRRGVAWWTIVSLTLAALALVRLGEVFVKRELTRRAAAVRGEIAGHRVALDDSLNRLSTLRVDYAGAQARARVEPEETHLELRKTTGRGQIMMGSKVVYEFRFRVRGASPVKVKGEVPELPEGVLSVQGRQDHTAWYKPDWMYEQAGEQVPKDSVERRIEDAFGRYAVALGGSVVIHGPVLPQIPAEAVDHVYAELNEKDLKAVYAALKVGSLVIIRH